MSEKCQYPEVASLGDHLVGASWSRKDRSRPSACLALRLINSWHLRSTVNMAHIKAHYFGSHPWLNPSGIVPIGPVLDLDAPVRPLNS
jgi:hypothetical protein